MGKGGQNKKPTALRVIEGNPGHRKLNKREPKPAPIRPTRPGWLLPEAKREWTRLAPELERLGLLTHLDRATFAAYCQAWAWVRRYEEIVAKEGMVIPGHRGVPRKHPLLSALNAATAAVRALGCEFGLTPVSRSRISLPTATDGDDWGNLLD